MREEFTQILWAVSHYRKQVFHKVVSGFLVEKVESGALEQKKIKFLAERQVRTKTRIMERWRTYIRTETANNRKSFVHLYNRRLWLGFLAFKSNHARKATQSTVLISFMKIKYQKLAQNILIQWKCIAQINFDYR